jgi:hypothetical protein
MKKLFYVLALVAVASFAFTGCKKGEPEGNKVVKRLTHLLAYYSQTGTEPNAEQGVDDFTISYNADGKIAKIERPDRSWTFSYEGNVITAAYVKEGSAKNPYVFTLGSNGYVASFVDYENKSYTCEYDAEGHLTKTTKNGEKKSELQWENGNLKKFSRYESSKWEWKEQTFLAEDNIGGVFPDCDDKAGIDRWMFEIGLFGKPSKKLVDQAAWETSELSAVQTYKKDADGYVTLVDKLYNGKHEFFGYTWEVVK